MLFMCIALTITGINVITEVYMLHVLNVTNKNNNKIIICY